MGGTFDARSTVQRAPKIITVPEFRCPDMDAHPNRQGTDILPVGGDQGALRIDGRAKRIARRLKSRAGRVANFLENMPAVSLHGRADQLIVPGERGGHFPGEFLPKARAPHDIREEKAYRSRWRANHSRNMEPRVLA